MTSIDPLISPSILGLTVLLAIGLAFFIRASTKDRTEQALYETHLDDITLFEKLQQYFADRAYRVTAVDEASGQISLQGRVAASPFLAVFLGSLAGIGFASIALVLTTSNPQWGYWPFVLLVLSPLSSWFYWRGANRVEQVTFAVRSPEETAPRGKEDATARTQLVVTAHRDEQATLASQLPLKRKETE